MMLGEGRCIRKWYEQHIKIEYRVLRLEVSV